MTQEMRKSDAEQIKRDEKISYWNEVSSYRTLIYGELEWSEHMIIFRIARLSNKERP